MNISMKKKFKLNGSIYRIRVFTCTGCVYRYTYIFTGKDDQSACNKHGVLPSFHHPRQPVQSCGVVWASHWLDQSRGNVVMLLSWWTEIEKLKIMLTNIFFIHSTHTPKRWIIFLRYLFQCFVMLHQKYKFR